MEKINKLYEEVKNFEEVLTEYNTTKNKIKQLERDVEEYKNCLEGEEKSKLQKKIKQLEKDNEKIELEIKKIDLLSKEVYSLGDLKIMFDYVVEEDVLQNRAISFLESLIYIFYVSFEQVEKIVKKNVKNLKENSFYKMLKINLQIEELLEITKCKSEVYFNCLETYKMILKNEMELLIPSRLLCFTDDSSLFILFLESSDEIEEKQNLKEVFYVPLDFLHTLNNSIDIFNEIFLRNLQKLLLSCSLSLEDVEETNLFFSKTEFYLTNVDEWKLDCCMKEIIMLTKRERKWETIGWLEEEAFVKGDSYYESRGVSKLVLEKDFDLLPEEISQNLFRILLCIKIVYSCNSTRINKAEKIIERALSKFIKQQPIGTLLHHFIIFADLTALIRLFPDSPITSSISTQRESLFFTISQLSTEVTRSLNDSLLLLQIYFKEKHYDFMLFINKFVPEKSRMAFEINFFSLIYANICDLILCINILDNEKAGDLARLLHYLLCLSSKVPSECIESYKRIESFAFVLKAPVEEVKEKRESLNLTKQEFEKLFKLLFK